MFLTLKRIFLFPFVHVWVEETLRKASILPSERKNLDIILNDTLWCCSGSIWKIEIMINNMQGAKALGGTSGCAVHEVGVGVGQTVITYSLQI